MQREFRQVVRIKRKRQFTSAQYAADVLKMNLRLIDIKKCTVWRVHFHVICVIKVLKAERCYGNTNSLIQRFDHISATNVTPALPQIPF